MNDSDHEIDPVDWALVDRYLARETSSHESSLVEQWMRTDAIRQQLIDAARTSLDPARNLPLPDAQAALARTLANRTDHHTDSDIVAPRRGLIHKSRTAIAVAGMTMALVIGVLSHLGTARMHGSASEGQVYATATGQRMSVTLFDGTHVTLGPESQLRVAATYGNGDRRVTLDGEAYFSVVHNAQHPFAVHTREATVTDVGTAFDIKAYASDTTERVVVAEGRVALNTDGRAVESRRTPLGAGDMVILSATGVATMRGVNVATLTGWLQGQLTFDNAPLLNVVREVGRTYGIDVVIADSALAKRTLTASFSNSQSLDVILESIARAVGAQVKRDGHRAVLTKRVTVSGAPATLQTAERGSGPA